MQVKPMRMDRRIYWLSILILGFAVTGSDSCAEEPVQKRPPHECRFVDNPPTVDGIADDPAWKSAQVIDRFTLPWLKDEERPARAATKARLAWDREFFYFVAEMEDRDLFADLTEHDGKIWNNDVFELFLKPAIDKTGYYEFQVNAAATVLDMFLPKRSFDNFEQQVKEGDFHVDAKVTRNGTLNLRTDKDQRWTVEGRIPWTDFLRTGGRPAPGEIWKFALCRYDYSVEFDEPELSSSAPLQIRSFHQFEDYSDLKFIGPATRAAEQNNAFDPHVKLPKLITSRVVGSPEPPDP